MPHQWNIIPVSAYNNYSVQFWGELNSVHRQPNVPVAFFRSAGKYLQVFCLDLISYLVQSVKEILLFLDISLYDIGYSSYKAPVPDSCLQYLHEIYFCIEKVLCRVIHILHVNKNSYSLVLELRMHFSPHHWDIFTIAAACAHNLSFPESKRQLAAFRAFLHDRKFPDFVLEFFPIMIHWTCS